MRNALAHDLARPTYRFRGSREPGRPGAMRASDLRASIVKVDDGDDPAVATLRLYDPIDSWGGDWGVSAKEFASALDSLPSDVEEIRLHINSPGGEVYEGITMLNLLRQHRARAVAIVDGIAASAASFLAAGADETIMAPNSQMMIHDAWGLGIGNAADLRELADVLDKISDNIAGVYAAKAGGTLEDWRAVMIAEQWYAADEAVEVGLADRVLDGEPVVVNDFDLSIFRHEGGRATAPPPIKPGDATDERWRDDVRRRTLARKQHLTLT